jgi:hypothetical protein
LAETDVSEENPATAFGFGEWMFRNRYHAPSESKYPIRRLCCVILGDHNLRNHHVKISELAATREMSDIHVEYLSNMN